MSDTKPQIQEALRILRRMNMGEKENRTKTHQCQMNENQRKSKRNDPV